MPYSIFVGGRRLVAPGPIFGGTGPVKPTFEPVPLFGGSLLKPTFEAPPNTVVVPVSAGAPVTWCGPRCAG